MNRALRLARPTRRMERAVADGSSPQATPFERIVLPHLDAGYTLALYLTHDSDDAEDAVQEAVLRALRYFHTLRSEGDARAWFLTIVRRECYASRGGARPRVPTVPYESASHLQLADSAPSPEDAAHRSLVLARVDAAVAALPERLRTTLILREVQQCSYEEIALVTEVPIGTVMSRLSRARARVAAQLGDVGDRRGSE